MRWDLKLSSLLCRPQKSQAPKGAARPRGPTLPHPAQVRGRHRDAGGGAAAGKGDPGPPETQEQGPRRLARTRAIRSRLSNPSPRTEVGTAAFHQKIHGFWRRSHSGSPNKSKSTQALSSRGQSSPPFASRCPIPAQPPRSPADPPRLRQQVHSINPQPPSPRETQPRQAAAEGGAENASPPGQPQRRPEE